MNLHADESAFKAGLKRAAEQVEKFTMRREYTDEEIEEGLREGVVLGLSKRTREAAFAAGLRAGQKREEACIKILLECLAKRPEAK